MTRTDTPRLTGIIVACAMTFAIATSIHAQDLSGIKCVVNGDQNASADASIEYRGGRVYVCCEKCVKQFQSEPAAFATRANHQLVLTGQYRQSKCPINGTEHDPSITANVGGANIAFCCQKCLKQVNDAETMPERAEQVFGDKAFQVSFVKVETGSATRGPKIDLEKAACVVEAKRKVSEEHSADYLDGKVFFCCPKCARAFKDDPAKHAVAANRQLVQTGQYVQAGCPLVGGPVSDQHATTVSGIPIKLCCEKCIAVIDRAKSPEEKADLIFSPERFAEAFKPASTQANQQPVEDGASK